MKSHEFSGVNWREISVACREHYFKHFLIGAINLKTLLDYGDDLKWNTDFYAHKFAFYAFLDDIFHVNYGLGELRQ